MLISFLVIIILRMWSNKQRHDKLFKMYRFILLTFICISICGCFPKRAGTQLEHFWIEAPDVGDIAPDFNLVGLDGNQVSLQSLLGNKPIVLQLGSHSCPVYRYRRFSMAKLYREYSEQAHFLLVYTVEAHPVGSNSPYLNREWVTSFNYLTNTLVPQAHDFDTRLSMAKSSHEKLSVAYPMIVDNINNEIWQAYGRAPSAAFVIDINGRITLRQPWVDPKGIKDALDKQFNEG